MITWCPFRTALGRFWVPHPSPTPPGRQLRLSVSRPAAGPGIRDPPPPGRPRTGTIARPRAGHTQGRPRPPGPPGPCFIMTRISVATIMIPHTVLWVPSHGAGGRGPGPKSRVTFKFGGRRRATAARLRRDSEPERRLSGSVQVAGCSCPGPGRRVLSR